MKAILFIAVLALAIFKPPIVFADPYFNSSETGCDSSNGNVVWCDDFETSGAANSPNGHWYGEDCDTANGNGGIDTRTKGWCGTIFNNPISPAGAAVCGSAGAAGTSCAGEHAGSSGIQDGTNNMADHGFYPALASYNDLYVRYYYQPSSDYTWESEKHLTINNTVPGNGGISIAGLGFPYDNGLLLCPVYDCNILGYNNPQCGGGGCPGSAYLNQNVGSSLNPIAGHWMFIEMRIKVNTPGTQNGIYELWVDDCGTNGLGCTGTPTKRASYTNVRFYDSGDSGAGIRSFWFENWIGASGSRGSSSKIDQIKVSKVGPIGFMGATSTPGVKMQRRVQ